LLILGVVAFIVRRVERWKARLRLERIEQQHAVEHERSRIAKDIHDDLGANLTQIVFLSERVEGTNQDAQEVGRWLKLIPATARRTIQSLDEIVWAINPKHDSLESLANYLSQFAQEHLTLAGVRCVLDVPTVLPALELNAELRHNLLLAAREALQNVVAHAAATEARVTLRLVDSGLCIEVTDSGSGFDLKRVSREGNGLQNMRRRLEDIGGHADITSKPGEGTTVRLTVPTERLRGRVTGKNERPA
jgi:signal transduction histidine kinase